MGIYRETKKALERYWSNKITSNELLEVTGQVRQEAWELQRRAGLDVVPCNDFSLYDHVLDTAVMVGAVPERFEKIDDDLDRYFVMARGSKAAGEKTNLAALEMTKWFDTNYHYLVPEFHEGQQFRLAWLKPVDEFLEAKRLGYQARPVLVGPVTFLSLGKSKVGQFEPLDLLDSLIPVYEELLSKLHQAGADWVQIDEPCLAMDTDERTIEAIEQAYSRLGAVNSGLKIMFTTYFGSIGTHIERISKLPVAGLHLDLVRAPEDLEIALKKIRPDFTLSLGLVDGRNVWRTDLEHAVFVAIEASKHAKIEIAPSCSLLHSPIDLEGETGIDRNVREWLAFSKQKIEELSIIAKAVNFGRDSVQDKINENRAILDRRAHSELTFDPDVRKRSGLIGQDLLNRQSAFHVRKPLQQDKLGLPEFPITTIGSFPQTDEVRKKRAEFESGKLSHDEYHSYLKERTIEAIRWQEEVGLDVLVHGEFERKDMVEHFGELLKGFVFSKNGWVQSYGSRCVKPPIIYGDVSRRQPMTTAWTRFAQALTERPVKGMLTGPVTILQWSFVRDDQPRSETCRQIALAIRDEVVDLEAGGAGIIQIDEPALREGLPLRKKDWPDYLRWAVDAFRLASSGVRDETQIHTHMCYCEFNDIIDSIAELDADVISIETSRSQMELLSAFGEFSYPNDIGPGVYDIHSPRIPTQDEIETLLRKAMEVLSPEQIWVNPDCGLKTRRWEEVKPALAAMVAAALALRTSLKPEESR
jgi:5-methyltetrahydropteroyltriglutamate--homocysteine methyltransferase